MSNSVISLTSALSALGRASSFQPPRHARDTETISTARGNRLDTRVDNLELNQCLNQIANALGKFNPSQGELDLCGIDFTSLGGRGSLGERINYEERVNLEKLLQEMLKEQGRNVNHPLYKARLIGTDLAGCNLQGAYLEEALFIRADLSAACLVKAKLRGANLTRAELGCTKMDEADLEGSILEKVNLAATSLDGVNLRNASLKGAWSFYETNNGRRIVKGDDLVRFLLDHNRIDVCPNGYTLAAFLRQQSDELNRSMMDDHDRVRVID